jgi:hypothetical protein
MRLSDARNILYVSYGEGPHLHETVFSALTMMRFGPDVRACVVTDQPEFFRAYGIDALPVTAEAMQQWMGAARLNHRCKIMALKHACETLAGTSIMVDGDTIFRASPMKLFERVAAGRSVMHMREGLLGESRVEGLRRAGRELAAAGIAQGAATMMWNAGVVGISRADGPLLDEVLAMTDMLLARKFLPQWEQISFSVVLAAKTKLQEARDVVEHYCVSPQRKQFRKLLPMVLAAAMEQDGEQRAAFLHERRLRTPLSARARVLVKDVANAVGVIPRRDRFDCV